MTFSLVFLSVKATVFCGDVLAVPVVTISMDFPFRHTLTIERLSGLC